VGHLQARLLEAQLWEARLWVQEALLLQVRQKAMLLQVQLWAGSILLVTCLSFLESSAVRLLELMVSVLIKKSPTPFAAAARNPKAYPPRVALKSPEVFLLGEAGQNPKVFSAANFPIDLDRATRVQASWTLQVNWELP